MYPSIVYEFNVRIQQCTYCDIIVIKKQNKISSFLILYFFDSWLKGRIYLYYFYIQYTIHEFVQNNEYKRN